MRKLATQRSSPDGFQPVSTAMQARSTAVPPPVEGWDTESPIASMPIKRAMVMDNWFPQLSWVEVRRGYIKQCDTGTGLPVETVMAYQGISTTALFAASGTSIFDVSISTPSTSVTGLTNARFQYINFATSGGNFLACVNGADGQRYYDGSTWQTATITGLTPGDIVGINAHKFRLWYVLKDSIDAYYLPVDSIQGAAVKFALGGLFTKGGYLMAMGTWSVDGGLGPQDYAVFVTSRGQVAIYNGTDPSSNFTLVAVFDMGAPIGRRCLVKIGADIAIISIDGVVPLSRAMIFERAAVAKVTLTQRIQRAMNDSARSYSGNFGWQLISYPKGVRAVLNIPTVENQTQIQYVMNTLSGAWCRFTGMNFNCFELYNDDLYSGGNTGIVYKCDTSGTDDGQETLTADLRTAFSFYGSPGQLKRWMMAQPIFTTNNLVQVGIALNTDFKTDAAISAALQPYGTFTLWNVATWAKSVWGSSDIVSTNWLSVIGIGHCASIRMKVDVTHPADDVNAAGSQVDLRINGFNMTYQPGWIV